MNKVFIAVPTYDGKICFQLANSLFQCTETIGHKINYNQFSLLAYGFNKHWANALNDRKNGYTHFAMVHADCAPEALWLTKMMDIMERYSADVLSVCMPIKNNLGLSSTAIDTDPWHPSRFTFKQLDRMVGTFTHPKLLINTGIMLVDMRKSWVEMINFRIEDGMQWNEGTADAIATPEDWNFSRDARELGAKIFATTEVTAKHLGAADYPNWGSWGLWETDQAYGEAKL